MCSVAVMHSSSNVGNNYNTSLSSSSSTSTRKRRNQAPSYEVDAEIDSEEHQNSDSDLQQRKKQKQSSANQLHINSNINSIDEAKENDSSSSSHLLSSTFQPPSFSSFCQVGSLPGASSASRFASSGSMAASTIAAASTPLPFHHLHHQPANHKRTGIPLDSTHEIVRPSKRRHEADDEEEQEKSREKAARASTVSPSVNQSNRLLHDLHEQRLERRRQQIWRDRLAAHAADQALEASNGGASLLETPIRPRERDPDLEEIIVPQPHNPTAVPPSFIFHGAKTSDIHSSPSTSMSASTMHDSPSPAISSASSSNLLGLPSLSSYPSRSPSATSSPFNCLPMSPLVRFSPRYRAQTDGTRSPASSSVSGAAAASASSSSASAQSIYSASHIPWWLRDANASAEQHLSTTSDMPSSLPFTHPAHQHPSRPRSFRSSLFPPTDAESSWAAALPHEDSHPSTFYAREQEFQTMPWNWEGGNQGLSVQIHQAQQYENTQQTFSDTPTPIRANSSLMQCD